MRAIAVIPTYNERDNLKHLVSLVFDNAGPIDVLIVDDDSPDGTGVLAEQLAGKFTGRLFVLHRPAKEGLGKAYRDGFRFALDRNYDCIVQMDADLSHDPGYLPRFLDEIRDRDLVLGSRYLRGISVVNWDFKRLLLSKTATSYVRLITGMPFTDTTGGFKCWRREALERVGLEGMFSNGYLFQIETTYEAFTKGFRIGEIPIVFVERDLGRSKMDWRIIWEAFWGVLRLRFRHSFGRDAAGNRAGATHIRGRLKKAV
ncbi:MAG TPA: polyprenol monophosphomannose synthase [Blastocatellia bacterium]|nr:polyprenol monophosphomannose synthase [Blastocatellia bacterium]